MANHPNRSNIANEKRDDTAQLWQAIGSKYGPDGWSDERALFRFWAHLGEAPHEIAEKLRRRGVGGAATYGCEEISRTQVA